MKAALRSISCVVLAWLSVSVASAAIVESFEPPDYAEGPIVGQGAAWVVNGYSDANTAGSANIVATGSLSGAQSLQIDSPDNTIRDISKSFSEIFSDPGPGNDISMSLLFRMPTAGRAVIVLSEEGINGGSPDFVLIDGADISQLDASFNFVRIGTYVVGNTFEFRLGFDLLGQTYDVSFRDVTAGGAFSTPSTMAQYFQSGGQGYLGDPGAPEMLTDPDVILGARRGSVYFDNLRLESVPEPGSVTFGLFGAAMLISSRRRRAS